MAEDGLCHICRREPLEEDPRYENLTTYLDCGETAGFGVVEDYRDIVWFAALSLVAILGAIAGLYAGTK